jgi:hypothetical protein
VTDQKTSDELLADARAELTALEGHNVRVTYTAQVGDHQAVKDGPPVAIADVTAELDRLVELGAVFSEMDVWDEGPAG